MTLPVLLLDNFVKSAKLGDAGDKPI